MIIRAAIAQDATSMSHVLSEILEMWGSNRQRDPNYLRSFYIEHPDNIRCSVAQDDQDNILGFQSLKIIRNTVNPYDLPKGWGIIGTYVRLDIGRRGIGSKLFKASLSEARKAGLKKIDATIAKSNPTGLAYYDAMGFCTYRTLPDSVAKLYQLKQD